MFQYYNNKNNETYGLYSLSEAFINTLTAAFGQYQNAHEVFFDLQLTAKKQWKERLEKAGELEATKAISAMHQITGDMVKEKNDLKEENWRKQQADTLSQEKVHNQLADASKSSYVEAQLRELKNRWLHHGNFAHFGDRALLRAYHTLSHIEEYVQFALTELDELNASKSPFKAKLPNAFYEDYAKHLEQTLATIHGERQRITASMYERLRIAASQQDLTAGDTLMHTIKRLKALSVVKKDYASTHKQQRTLSPEHFNQFHQAIFDKGDATTQKRTLELPWFNLKETLPGQGLSLKAGVAKQFGLAKQIPKKLKKPEWLFKGTATRFHFFEEPYTFASLAASIERLKQTTCGYLDPLTIEKSLFELTCVSTLLDELNERAELARKNVTKGLRRFFTRQTQDFLTHYQQQLTSIKTDEQKELTQFLGRITKSLNEDLLEPSPSLDNTFEQLQTLGLMQDDNAQLALTHVIEAITQAKERKVAALKKAQHLATINRLLSPLEQQTKEAPANPKAIQEALAYYKGIKRADDEITQEFLNRFDALMQNAEENFQAPNAIDSDNLENFKQHMSYLQNLGQLLKKAGRHQERHRVNETLENLQFQYMNQWTDNDNQSPTDLKHKHDVANITESVLLSLGDESDVNTIKCLNQLRTEGRYEELNLRCQQQGRLLERRVINRYLAKEFKALEKTLFVYIKNKHQLELTPAQMKHISALCRTMADERVNDIDTYESLTSTDIAFIGLHDMNVFQKLFGSQRTPLRAVINIIAKLRVAATTMPYVADREQRKQSVLTLKAQIHQQIEQHGERKLHSVVSTQPFFSDEDEDSFQSHHSNDESESLTQEGAHVKSIL